MESSVTLHATLIVSSILTFVATTFFYVEATTGSFNGLFLTTIANTTEEYVLEVSLDNWLSTTWILIGVWNGLWLVYVFSTLFRRNVFGTVCCNPEIHPPSFYVFWIFNNLLSIGWLFLWDWQYIFRALSLKILIPYSCYVMLTISYRNLYRHGSWLKINSPQDLWYIRYLIQNGVALYASWTSVEALINFGIVLKYKAGIEDPAVSTIVLTLLLFEILLWFVLENFIFEKYVRYTFTVYPVVILALGGMFTRNYHYDTLPRSTIYCGALMILTAVICVIRLIAICFYDERRPLFVSRIPFPLSDGIESLYHPKIGQNGASKFGVENKQFSKT
ncbi:uncharacterized protein [Lepisosteus oculatus]|uniref:uncharacterized protein n=1 Tax=Lepisosteus oculatus TaxID=7918 RepID=UPI00074027AC|nr:PREDICTED: uncharacterized protein LOC107078262 [Lepisosteus oculatus]